jgi:hypothetical protein
VHDNSDEKSLEGGYCMLFGLGFLIVIHEKEKCKYFHIFLWAVTGCIYYTVIEMMLEQDCC